MPPHHVKAAITKHPSVILEGECGWTLVIDTHDEVIIIITSNATVMARAQSEIHNIE